MKKDRIFIRDAWRHYRRTYSLVEFRAGLVLLACMVLIAGWVAWKGSRPEPGLYDLPGGLYEEEGEGPGRGPLPEALAPAGWREGGVSNYDAGNLYEKIDGRADYYLSFGFERLWVLSIVHEDDPARVVDVELFAQGAPANALGAYEGERAPGIEPTMDEAGLSHLDRNALFMTRGRHYVRAIGSEESEEVRLLLKHLKSALEAGLPGEPLPWAYALFVGEMGLRPGGVSFRPVNAFSFGFASNVHIALLDDGETEVFVAAQENAGSARLMAARFTGGFLLYGSPAEKEEGVAWVRDLYLGTIAGASAQDAWILGVRGAPDIPAARDSLAALRRGVAALPEEAAARARREALGEGAAASPDETPPPAGYTGDAEGEDTTASYGEGEGIER